MRKCAGDRASGNARASPTKPAYHALRRPGLLKPRRLGSSRPANVAGFVGPMLRCHGRGPYGRPCSQNNQKHHTKSGLWLRSRRNRIAPTSSWGPAPASPYEPSRISGRQKSRLSSLQSGSRLKPVVAPRDFGPRRPISRLRTCAFRAGRS